MGIRIAHEELVWGCVFEAFVCQAETHTGWMMGWVLGLHSHVSLQGDPVVTPPLPLEVQVVDTFKRRLQQIYWGVSKHNAIYVISESPRCGR